MNLNKSEEEGGGGHEVPVSQKPCEAGPEWRTVSFVLAVVLATVFGAAAATKFHELPAFQAAMFKSNVIPASGTRILATVVLCAEGSVAAFLLGRRTRQLGFWGSLALSVVFLGYGIYREVGRIPGPCHCFGLVLTMTPVQTIGLNVALLLTSATGIGATYLTKRSAGGSSQVTRA